MKKSGVFYLEMGMVDTCQSALVDFIRGLRCETKLLALCFLDHKGYLLLYARVLADQAV